MSWRDSPACARQSSTSTSSAKARSTSSFVIAEKRARWIGAFLLTSRTSPAASLPMSSPSRSKSVAITISSAFLATLFSERMSSRSAGVLPIGAHTRYGSESDLPRLEVDAVGRERLLLLPRGRPRSRSPAWAASRGWSGTVTRSSSQTASHAPPSTDELQREVHAEDVALEADRDPVLAVAAELVDRRVVDLVGRRLADGEYLGQLLGGDVLLGDDELQVRVLPDATAILQPSIHRCVNTYLVRGAFRSFPRSERARSRTPAPSTAGHRLQRGIDLDERVGRRVRVGQKRDVGERARRRCRGRGRTRGSRRP